MNIIKVIGIAAGIAVAGLAGLVISNPGNVAETSDDAAELSLKTRYYQVDLTTFAEECGKIIPTLTTYGQSWKIVSTEVNENSAHFKTEVPVAFFVDEMDVKAEKDEEHNGIKVNIYSKSRVGKSDLGENRRHVLQILQAFDNKFTH